MVFKHFGQLCLVSLRCTLVPFVVPLIFGDTPISVRYGIVIGGLAALGACLARLRGASSVQANEGMVLVALMFLFTPLVMSYPMMGSGLGFLDAFFEAVSGVTTTRSEHEGDARWRTGNVSLCRAWMQWYGGLGIVVLSLALVMQPGLLAKGLAVTEAETDDLVGGTRAHARRGLKVYGVLTALGIIGSLLVGLRFFDAVLYAFAAVSTGGFAPHDGSLATFGWPAGVDYLASVSRQCRSGVLYRMFRENRRVAVDFQLWAVDRFLVATLLVVTRMRVSGGIVLATSASSRAAARRFRADQRGFFLDAVRATRCRLELAVISRCSWWRGRFDHAGGFDCYGS